MTTRFFKLNEHEKEQRRNEVQDWLAKPGNNFCAMPYAHMAIESNGSVRPCCMGEPFDYTVAGGTIDDALNHPIEKNLLTHLIVTSNIRTVTYAGKIHQIGLMQD